MSNKIVIGIDGGGTTTRVLAADLEGRILSYVESGMARWDRNQEAIQNVQGAITKAVHESQRDLLDVAYVVAGIAGLDRGEDQEWVKLLTNISELQCPRKHVNDAVIAHAGALMSKPGIIAISGTGSVIYGITESGRHIRNYDMQHYANSGARHIVYTVLFYILIGEYTSADEALVQHVLNHWNVSSIEKLKGSLTHEGKGFINTDCEHLAKLAPIITEGAKNGLPLAKSACDKAVDELSIGIRLVGSQFLDEAIDVAFIGSVIRSEYISSALKTRLQKADGSKSFRVVEPMYSSQAGALLMALNELRIPIDSNILENIRCHPKSTMNG